MFELSKGTNVLLLLALIVSSKHNVLATKSESTFLMAFTNNTMITVNADQQFQPFRDLVLFSSGSNSPSSEVIRIELGDMRTFNQTLNSTTNFTLPNGNLVSDQFISYPLPGGVFNATITNREGVQVSKVVSVKNLKTESNCTGFGSYAINVGERMVCEFSVVSSQVLETNVFVNGQLASIGTKNSKQANVSLFDGNLAMSLIWDRGIVADARTSIEYYLLLSHMYTRAVSPVVAFEFYVRDISEMEATFMNIEIVQVMNCSTAKVCDQFLNTISRKAKVDMIRSVENFDIHLGYNEVVLAKSIDIKNGQAIMIEMSGMSLALANVTHQRDLHVVVKKVQINGILPMVSTDDSLDYVLAFRPRLVQTSYYNTSIGIPLCFTNTGQMVVDVNFTTSDPIAREKVYAYSIGFNVSEALSDNATSAEANSTTDEDDVTTTSSITESATMISASTTMFDNSKALIESLFNMPDIRIDQLQIENVLLLLREAEGNLNGCLANCSNNGRCAVNIDKKFACICENELYIGDDCDTINPKVCYPGKCLNNGTCTTQYESKVSSLAFVASQLDRKPIGYTCECRDFYHGPNCQYKENPCRALNVNCSDHGVCVASTNVPECVCFVGYSGGNCEVVSEEIKFVRTVSNVAVIASCFIMAGMLSVFIIMDAFKLARFLSG